MSKILKFAWLDLLAIKPFFIRTTIMMAVIALGIGFAQHAPETTVVVFGAYTMFFILVPFSVGEKSGLDRFYSTLAINRNTVVEGRYAFTFLCQVAAAVLSILAGIFLKIILHTDTRISDLVASAVVIQLVLVIFLAVCLPIFFKMGYTKARLFMFIPFIGIMVVTPFLEKLLKNVELKQSLDQTFAFVENNPIFALLVAILTSLLFYTASAAVSSRIYAKMEF